MTDVQQRHAISAADRGDLHAQLKETISINQIILQSVNQSSLINQLTDQLISQSINRASERSVCRKEESPL